MAHMDMGWVLDLRGLTPAEKSVLTVLTCHANQKTRQTWVSHATIAEEAGYSRTSRKTVINALQSLEAKGLINTQHRAKEGGAQTSNLYTVHIGNLPQVPEKQVSSGSGVVDNHRGCSSQPQGVWSTTTGGVVHNHTNKELNKELDKELESFTSNSHELPSPQNPGQLPTSARAELITCITRIAETENQDGYTTVDVINAWDDFEAAVTEHLGADFGHLISNKWSFTADDCDRYNAGKQLNLIINTGAQEGYTVEGAA